MVKMMPSGQGGWQFIAITLACTAITATVIAIVLPFLAGVPPVIILIVGVIYLVSHILRAIRLALLSIDLLGVSGRTAALMHLAAAPMSLTFPFKSGEFVRLYELWKLSGTAVYAVLVLLIDRMFDSLFLLPVLVMLIIQGGTSPMFIILTLLASIIPLTVIVVGPRLLTELQRYVLVNHNNPRTIEALRQIDSARVLVFQTAVVARKRAPELCVISFLIWLCELVVGLILVSAMSSSLPVDLWSTLDLLSARLVSSWWFIGSGPLVAPALAIAMIAIMLPWPVVTALYLLRRHNEPRRTSEAERMNRRATV